MAPILGIIASGISGNLFNPTGNYYSIATTSLSSASQTSVTFSSIPSTYTHLQLRGIVACTVSGTDQNAMLVSANGDTSTGSYYTHALYGNGSSAATIANNGYGGALYTSDAPKTGNTNMFGGFVIDILDYSNVNKYKTFRTLQGADLNGSGRVWLSSAVYMSTSAISSLTISIAYAGDLARYSHFALYGIKG